MLHYEDLEKVVLVGCSAGGAVITGIAERVPERLAQLIYLDAFVLRDGESLFECAGSFGAFLEARARDMGDGWRVPHMLPDADRRTDYLAKAGKTRLSVGNPAAAELPHTFIHCTGKSADDPTKPIFEEMAARARDAGWRYRELPTGHWPLLSHPRETADLILELVR